MAERIDTKPGHGGHRWSKHPWAEWTDGSSWRIQRGVDYDALSSSMAAIIRDHAKRHGLQVQTALWQDGDGVEFQFTRQSEQAAA